MSQGEHACCDYVNYLHLSKFYCFQRVNFSVTYRAPKLMHQSIPAAPSGPPPPPPPPPPTLGLLQSIWPPFCPGGGAFANFALPGGRHLPTPGLFPNFWHARSLLSEYNYTEDVIGKIAGHVAHLSRTGGCKGMFSILCMQFFIVY